MGNFYKNITIMKLKGIEIKPGMVIITENAKYVAFPSKRSGCPIAFANIETGGWTSVIPETSINEIHDLFTAGVIDSGKLLWTKAWEKVVTMDEIAEKFGIPVKCLRIKKE